MPQQQKYAIYERGDDVIISEFFEEIQARTGGEVHDTAWAELILRTNLSFFLIEPYAGGPDLLEELQHLLHFLTESE